VYKSQEETSASIDNSRFYTRAGSFRAAIAPDDATAALLQNTGGFYLTGIPVDDRDNLPNPTSLTQLETVNINRISNSARATEEAKVQANLPSELTQTGATVTVFNPDGTQKAFLSGTTNAAGQSLDPTQIATQAGDVIITQTDGTAVTLTAADYLSRITTAGVTAAGQIAGGGAVNFGGGALTLTVNGESVSIDQADLLAAGFTDGADDAATLATAINALANITPGDTTYTLAAAVVGDELQISATNPNTALDVAVRNIGGIVDAVSYTHLTLPTNREV